MIKKFIFFSIGLSVWYLTFGSIKTLLFQIKKWFDKSNQTTNSITTKKENTNDKINGKSN